MARYSDLIALFLIMVSAIVSLTLVQMFIDTTYVLFTWHGHN